MGMMQEFKEFAMKGNVIDMAVGIVIGGAFGKIVSSFVGKVVMPAVGMLTGGVDLSVHKMVLQEADAANEVAEVAIGYGEFLNSVIDFVIIAFAIFLVVKAMNKAKDAMKKEEAAAPPAPTEKECGHCMTNIPIKATRCPNCTSQLEG